MSWEPVSRCNLISEVGEEGCVELAFLDLYPQSVSGFFSSYIMPISQISQVNTTCSS